MKLTRDHLALTFPPLAGITDETTTPTLTRRLSSLLCSTTDNWEYAADLAKVLISHIDDGLYSDLPPKLRAYRASVDLFFSAAPEERAGQYLRACVRTLTLKRNSVRFHHALLGEARRLKLPVPDAMLTEFTAHRDICVRVHMPTAVYKRLVADARALDCSVPNLIRERILDYDVTHPQDILSDAP